LGWHFHLPLEEKENEMPRVSDGESGFQEILRRCGTELALTCPAATPNIFPEMSSVENVVIRRRENVIGA
jgi:hypothetical protein